MEKYQEHIELVKEFNALPNFVKKLEFVKEHSDKIIIGCDYNWWRVKFIDQDIDDLLSDKNISFEFDNEWDWNH